MILKAPNNRIIKTKIRRMERPDTESRQKYIEYQKIYQIITPLEEKSYKKENLKIIKEKICVITK